LPYSTERRNGVPERAGAGPAIVITSG
jgi:hypothetical protein